MVDRQTLTMLATICYQAAAFETKIESEKPPGWEKHRQAVAAWEAKGKRGRAPKPPTWPPMKPTLILWYHSPYPIFNSYESNREQSAKYGQPMERRYCSIHIPGTNCSFWKRVFGQGYIQQHHERSQAMANCHHIFPGCFFGSVPTPERGATTAMGPGCD